MRRHSLLASLLTIALCLSMIVGSTYALFTSEDSVIIEATGAKIKVSATVGDLSLTSIDEAAEGGVFSNGGTAAYDSETGVLTLSRLTPGDAVSFGITLTNESDVNILYRLTWAIEGALADALSVTVDGKALVAGSSEWTAWEAPAEESETAILPVSIALPIDADNSYMEAAATISFKIEAIQGNAPTWDGTADTTWYNEEATEFALSDTAALAGLAELVDSGVDFTGKTIKLEADLDLRAFDDAGNRVSFDPIGDAKGMAFTGTFDGQGHTIENLYQSGWDFGYEWGSYGSIGLFGEVKDATVKNVTISGFDAQIEGGDIAGITGSATGTCVFENITIEDSTFGTYNNGIGGIIGWSGAGNYTFKDITIGEDVVLGGLWGSFDSSIGGVVGQGEPGATYTFENVNVACRLDAYNDCTASYDYYNYRMTGMLIGRLAKTTTIDGTNYPDMSQYNITCTDVTVTYGDWANYHYCRTAGARAKRVEAGYTYGGIAEDYDHSTCTAHCRELIAFRGLFGGDQYGVKPILAYEGVSIVRSISSAEGLVEFANSVAEGNSYKGMTVVLADDIDMKDVAWEPIAWDHTSGIGFAGTFDGQDHTIKNLTIVGESNVGFFSGIHTTAVIENIVFDNAAVSGTHYVGVVIGWEGNESANATVKNITVKNSTVTCDTTATPDKDGEYDGDKAGGIVGYAVSLNIVDCTVKDTTVTAYRDLGGIAGHANGKVVVKGNTVENVTLIIDNDNNYKNYTEDAQHNADPIVGRQHENAVLGDNTVN